MRLYLPPVTSKISPILFWNRHPMLGTFLVELQNEP
jgi:hypothetical protein